MPRIPGPSKVEQEGDYVCVRYRDPEEFETLQTTEWARKAPESVVDGCELRVGKRVDGENWIPQEILIPEPVDAIDARRKADEILQRIDY